MTSTPRDWERQKGEPAEWFARFTQYRLLGRTRTLEAVWASEQRAGKGKRPTRHWYHHSGEWQWKERAAAWDIAQVEQEAEENARLRRELARKGMDWLSAHVPKKTHTVKPKEWADMLRLIFDELRTEYGQQPTTKLEVTHRLEMMRKARATAERLGIPFEEFLADLQTVSSDRDAGEWTPD